MSCKSTSKYLNLHSWHTMTVRNKVLYEKESNIIQSSKVKHNYLVPFYCKSIVRITQRSMKKIDAWQYQVANDDTMDLKTILAT